MDNVFNFPTQTARNWADIERAILDHARNTDIDTASATGICARVRVLYDLLTAAGPDFSLDAPEQCGPALSVLYELFKKEGRERNARVLTERITREFELHHDR